MKKGLKIYLCMWVVIVITVVVILVMPSNTHHKLAMDPYNIEKITKLDLPEIVKTETEDNLDRTTSCWDCFYQRVEFAEELSPECILELEHRCRTDSLHWKCYKKNECYGYVDEAWCYGGDYSIICRINKDSSWVEYYVDEFEDSLFYVIIAMLVLLLELGIAFIWGIVLIIIAVIRRVNKASPAKSGGSAIK